MKSKTHLSIFMDLHLHELRILHYEEKPVGLSHVGHLLLFLSAAYGCGYMSVDEEFCNC